MRTLDMRGHGFRVCRRGTFFLGMGAHREGAPSAPSAPPSSMWSTLRDAVHLVGEEAYRGGSSPRDQRAQRAQRALARRQNREKKEETRTSDSEEEVHTDVDEDEDEDEVVIDEDRALLQELMFNVDDDEDEVEDEDEDENHRLRHFRVKKNRLIRDDATADAIFDAVVAFTVEEVRLEVRNAAKNFVEDSLKKRDDVLARQRSQILLEDGRVSALRTFGMQLQHSQTQGYVLVAQAGPSSLPVPLNEKDVAASSEKQVNATVRRVYDFLERHVVSPARLTPLRSRFVAALGARKREP